MSLVSDTPSGSVRAAHRSWWMEEALTADPGRACPPLVGDESADVVVVGGGYTGLWTAFFLHERNPDLDLVVLEQDICGGGPSGRNGGFLNAMWDKLYSLAQAYGDDAALRACRIADASVSEIGDWCERFDVDAWFDRKGDIGVSSSPTQDGAWEWTIDYARKFGLDDMYEAITPEQVAARCSSPVLRGGMHVPSGAHVQPARLARGLRRALLDRGVRIYEGSGVVHYEGGVRPFAQTARGRVNAKAIVVGTGAYAAADPKFRRKILPLASYMVVTAPAPERLAEIGWTGGEGLYDFRWALHYVRTTRDGRIVMGSPTYGPGLTHRVDFDGAFVGGLVRDLVRWFPGFADVPIECGWGGPIDSTAAHTPFFGTMPEGNVHYALGFMGEGIGPTHLAGKVLSGLALGEDDEYTTLPMVGTSPRSFPPRAILTPGAALVYRSIVRKDSAQDYGRSPGRLTDFVAGLPARFGY